MVTGLADQFNIILASDSVGRALSDDTPYPFNATRIFPACLATLHSLTITRAIAGQRLRCAAGPRHRL